MAGGTRERILDAAEVLFVERGVGNVSIVEVERSSGLSPGSGAFYRHFTCKGDLYEAVVDREAERIEASGLLAPTTAADVADRGSLEAELARRMEVTRRMRKLLAFMMRDDGEHPQAATRLSEMLVRCGHAACTPGVGGDDPAASEMVVVLAQIGFVMANEFFGASPSEISSQRFVAALAEMVDSVRSGS